MHGRALVVVVPALVLMTVGCGRSGDEPAASAVTEATAPMSAPVQATSTTAAPVPTTGAVPTPTVTPALPSTTEMPSTTTSLPGAGVPLLKITLPESNEHVDHVWCPFAGSTEPGVVLVAAGRYPIEVAADGSWSTVLRLNPGGNVATFTATDAAGNVAEERVAVYYDPPLVLRADGLGDARFFDSMDSVLSDLIDLLGPPSADRVVTSADLPPELGGDGDLFPMVAYPAIEYFRSVHWNGVGLEVMFSDRNATPFEQWPPPPGPAVFNGWIVSDPGEFGAYLRTANGAGLGTSLAELEALYGFALTRYPDVDELAGDWHFSIDSGLQGWYEGETLRISGRLDSDPLDPPTHVSRLQAGFGYDEC